ncbi:MAG: sulfotransferase [Thermoleophilaceae bacterium]|nr:sulfotransferase [Thermoleophilaceae bacterium]
MKTSPICVVGMHRSGTSLTTRVLAALGVDLGVPASLIAPDAVDSPAGYQEQEAIVALDDELLRALGGHASEPPAPEDGWELSAEIQPFAARASAILGHLYERTPWAFKDPRASFLLPFWRTVVPDLRVLICVRNPLEVARSMDRRNDPYPLEHWLEMWALHLRAAITGSEGSTRKFVVYDDLIADPAGSAQSLAQFALGEPPAPEQLAAAAALPDSQIRRSAIDDETLLADPRVDNEIALSYFRLRDWVRAAAAEVSADSGSIDSRASNPITTQP